MKGEITHLAPPGQRGAVLPASAECVCCAGWDTKPVHVWPSRPSVHLPWTRSKPGRLLPMPTPTRWLMFQGESASPGLSCRLPSGGAPEPAGRTGECGMGEERQWPREASCSGPRRGHASPRGHPALGGSSWGRLLAQAAQGPGENAPLCVQGPAPRISGLSAWALQAGGPPDRRGVQAPGVWLPGVCLCD